MNRAVVDFMHIHHIATQNVQHLGSDGDSLIVYEVIVLRIYFPLKFVTKMIDFMMNQSTLQQFCLTLLLQGVHRQFLAIPQQPLIS